MGHSISTFFSNIFSKTSYNLVLCGLDGSGKTTILYKMKLGETVYTMPTIGFNVEEIKFKNNKIIAWDLGGAEKIRPLWERYYKNIDGIIYIIDSSDDEERMETNRKEIERISSSLEKNGSLESTVCLILANKQDLCEAKTVSDIASELELISCKIKNWNILPSSAILDEGLEKAFSWLINAIQKVQISLKSRE